MELNTSAAYILQGHLILFYFEITNKVFDMLKYILYFTVLQYKNLLVNNPIAAFNKTSWAVIYKYLTGKAFLWAKQLIVAQKLQEMCYGRSLKKQIADRWKNKGTAVRTCSVISVVYAFCWYFLKQSSVSSVQVNCLTLLNFLLIINYYNYTVHHK